EEFNGYLYAGQGEAASVGDIYVCNPATSQAPGNDTTICDNDEWFLSYNGAQEGIRSLEAYNGKLYAGQSSGAGDSDVYVCDPARNTTGHPSFNTTDHRLVCDANEWTISYNGAGTFGLALAPFKSRLYFGQYSGGALNNNIVVLGYNNTDVINSTTKVWEANQWYHIAGVYNGSSMLVYVNGILENQKAVPMLIEQNITNLLIGYDSGSGFFNGTIDEVAIWNRSLSDLEVANLYNLTYGKYYWKANATDLAGNVNNTGIFEFTLSAGATNTAPTDPNTTIRPIIPLRNSSLNCSFTFIDTDNNTGNGTIIWYNNSIEHFRINISILTGNNTIASYQLNYNNTNNFTSSQNWTCAARTNDNTINSNNWVNASVVINNTKPHNPVPFIFSQPFLSDSTIRTNSSLNASSIIIDPDANDTRSVEIQFYNGSRLHFRSNLTDVPNGTNASYTLTENSTNVFSKGENWTSAFRIYDGINLSDWVNSSRLISNTNPRNANTTIRPVSPTIADNLNCSFTYIDTDDDQGTGIIIFYNNSAEHVRTNITISNISSNNTVVSYLLISNTSNVFTAGENWTCAVRTNDGVINSDNWVNSSALMYSSKGLTTGGKTEPGKLVSSQPSIGTEEKTIVENIQLLTQGNIYTYSQLAPGSNKIELQDKSLSFESLELFSSTLMSNVKIDIEESDRIENTKKLENAYGYIKIDHTNLLDSQITSRIFTFKISKSLTQNKEVSLYLYENNEWLRLPTEKLKEEGNFVYYQSKSPHLSIFAIRIYEKEGIFTKEELTQTISKIKNKEVNKEKVLLLIAAMIFIVLLIGFFRYVFNEEDQTPKISKSQENHNLRLNKMESKAPFLKKTKKIRKVFKKKYLKNKRHIKMRGK
ncbi:PGF-pre-PGF domain-containing protein, partial [Candidatus Woesearchaeota archaeon]|nr:PGF-pre-PGF domain-containing protein [Candidatus Woesearchaeota archaeon]